MGSSPEVRGTENRICGFPIRAFLLIFVLSFAIRAVLLVLWAAGHPDFLHFWCGPLRHPWKAALVTTVTVLALLGLLRAFPALDAAGRAVLLIPLAMFPLVYHFVSYVAHYPAPLLWLLLLLAGAEAQRWTEGSA